MSSIKPKRGSTTSTTVPPSSDAAFPLVRKVAASPKNKQKSNSVPFVSSQIILNESDTDNAPAIPVVNSTVNNSTDITDNAELQEFLENKKLLLEFMEREKATSEKNRILEEQVAKLTEEKAASAQSSNDSKVNMSAKSVESLKNATSVTHFKSLFNNICEESNIPKSLFTIMRNHCVNTETYNNLLHTYNVSEEKKFQVEGDDLIMILDEKFRPPATVVPVSSNALSKVDEFCAAVKNKNCATLQEGIDNLTAAMSFIDRACPTIAFGKTPEDQVKFFKENNKEIGKVILNSIIPDAFANEFIRANDQSKTIAELRNKTLEIFQNNENRFKRKNRDQHDQSGDGLNTRDTKTPKHKGDKKAANKIDADKIRNEYSNKNGGSKVLNDVLNGNIIFRYKNKVCLLCGQKHYTNNCKNGVNNDRVPISNDNDKKVKS